MFTYQSVEAEEGENIIVLGGCCGEFAALSLFYFNSLRAIYPAIAASLYTYYYPESNEALPMLAESRPQISSDNKTYVVTLREGLKFANGNDLDAEDVVFSYQAYLTKKINRSPEWYQQEKLASYLGSNSSVVFLDDRRIQFSFSEPNIANEEALTIPIVEKARYGERYNNCVLGVEEDCDWTGFSGEFLHSAGPYMLNEIFPAENGIPTGFDLVRNPYYFDQSSWADRIVVPELVNDTLALDGLAAGELDILLGRFPEIPDGIESYPQYTTKVIDSNLNHVVMVNFLHPILGTGEGIPDGENATSTNNQIQSRLVRQAISHTIDREVAASYFPSSFLEAKPSPSYIYRYVEGTNDSLEPDIYDLDLAKSMMEQAGFSYDDIVDANGDGDYVDAGDTAFFNMTFTPYWQNPGRNNTSIQMAEDMGKIGINVSLFNSIGFAEALNRTYLWPNDTLVPVFDEGGFDMTMWGSVDESQFYTFWWRLTEDGLTTSDAPERGQNFFNYQNPVVASLINNYLASIDVDERAEIVSEVEMIADEDLPLIPVVDISTYIIHKKGLSGFDEVMYNVGHIDWRYITGPDNTPNGDDASGPTIENIAILVAAVTVLVIGGILAKRRILN